MKHEMHNFCKHNTTSLLRAAAGRLAELREQATLHKMLTECVSTVGNPVCGLHCQLFCLQRSNVRDTETQVTPALHSGSRSKPRSASVRAEAVAVKQAQLGVSTAADGCDMEASPVKVSGGCSRLMVHKCSMLAWAA